MKKCISLILSIIICLTVTPSVTAIDYRDYSHLINSPDYRNYINPFTGQTYYSYLALNGVIDITLTHEKSVNWREYSQEDFPLLDIDYITFNPPSQDPEEIAKEDYRIKGFLILIDIRDKAVVEAVEILYNNYRDIIYQAIPDTTMYRKTEPNGDANADGITNLTDVTLILQYIAGWDVSIPPEGYLGPAIRRVDVYRDDTINLIDVSLILKVLAGWKDTD